MDDLLADCDLRPFGCNPCIDLCEVYKAYAEIRARQGSRTGGLMEQGGLFKPQAISTEGLDRQKDRWAATSNPGAKPIGVTATPISLVSSPAPTPTAREAVRALTDDEIRERILALEPGYRKWLDVAGPVLTREELERFLQMSSSEKDKFIREFWRKRK